LTVPWLDPVRKVSRFHAIERALSPREIPAS
jgi:hypothetical protein